MTALRPHVRVGIVPPANKCDSSGYAFKKSYPPAIQNKPLFEARRADRHCQFGVPLGLECFLNDKAELLHALNASKRAIALLSSRKALKAWSPVLRRLFQELSDGQRPDTYVACFCGDDDNLSQWRGYGGAVQGVSITFDRAALARRLQNDKAKLYRVTYAKLSTASKLRDALAGELADLAELEESPEESSEEDRHNELLSRVSALLPKFKHIGFRDEREWRFVVQRRLNSDQLQFRASGNKIVPYIVVGAKKTRLPILSVRVGPGTDQDLTAKGLRLFLEARGYNDVRVDISDVPYRP